VRKVILILGFAVLATSCVHEGRHGSSGKEPETQTIEVVGVLAGYEGPVTVLSTGQSVPTFTIDPADASCSCKYLFSVLTPTNLTGRFFFVRDQTPIVKHPDRVFKPATRYRFQLKVVDGDSPFIGTVPNCICVKEAPVSSEEIEARLNILREREAFLMKQLAAGNRILEKDLTNDRREGIEKWMRETKDALRAVADRRAKVAALPTTTTNNYPDVLDLKWEETSAE
jgi:hypothetical protein